MNEALNLNYTECQAQAKSKRTRGYHKYSTNKAGTGFIKMMVGWEASPIFEGRKDYQDIFLCLVRIANYKNTHEIVGRKRIELQRGQCFTSVREIAEATGLLAYDDDGLPLVQKDGKFKIKEQVVRSALLRFKEAEMITDEAWNRGRVITVVNYEKYQSKNTAHENVYYPSFQKSKVIEALTEERKGLPILNKTSKKRTTNEQLTSYISNTEQTNPTDKKEKESIKKNELSNFSKNEEKWEGQNIPILEIDHIPESEKKVDDLKLNSIKQAYASAFRLDINLFSSRKLVNTMKPKTKEGFLSILKQYGEENTINILKNIFTEAKEPQPLAWFLPRLQDSIKEKIEASQLKQAEIKKKEEERKALLEHNKAHLDIDAFMHFLKYHDNESKSCFGWFKKDMDAKAWEVIFGYMQWACYDGRTLVISVLNKKVKNYLLHDFQNRFESTLKKAFEKFFNQKLWHFDLECQHIE